MPPKKPAPRTLPDPWGPAWILKSSLISWFTWMERKLLLGFTSMRIPNDGGLRLKGEEKLKSVWTAEWTPDCIKAEGCCVVNSTGNVFIPHSSPGKRIMMQLHFSVVVSRQLISYNNSCLSTKSLHWIRLFNGYHCNGARFSSSGVIRRKVLVIVKSPLKDFFYLDLLWTPRPRPQRPFTFWYHLKQVVKLLMKVPSAGFSRILHLPFKSVHWKYESQPVPVSFPSTTQLIKSLGVADGNSHGCPWESLRSTKNFIPCFTRVKPQKKMRNGHSNTDTMSRLRKTSRQYKTFLVLWQIHAWTNSSLLQWLAGKKKILLSNIFLIELGWMFIYLIYAST